MENVEKGKTAKYLRDKQGVPEQVKESLKEFTRIKKTLLTALGEREMTIKELSESVKMPSADVMFNLMSLVKYGFVEVGGIDDMDEYYTYKIKQ
jgi:DNA-directed RNA polymerase specialized sigma subunit